MPSSQHYLQTLVDRAWPGNEWCDSHVVLAVSAGPDSAAMLRAVQSQKQVHGGRGQVHVAHFNHQLRGQEADADQAWLERLCRRLAIPLAIGRAATPVDLAGAVGRTHIAGEAAARDARYDFLRAMAERLGARYVAVAHTADDQVETVLHRIVRGTGLAGLAGMPFARPLSPSVALVRPLLLARRRDVLQYLSEIGQDFREDASNEDWRFTRNRLRHGLLPLLRRQYNPDVDAALLRLAAQAGEAQKLLAEQAALLADRFVVVEAGRDVRIDCSQLADKPRLILREVCKAAWARAGWPQQDADFDLWQQLAELVMHPESGAPTLNLPGNIRAARQGEEIVLRPSLEFS